MAWDRTSFERRTNARPFNRVARVHQPVRRKPAHIIPFGSRAATSLLLLELAAHGKIADGWDADWYVGEFLSRLRAALFAAPDVTGEWREAFDREAAMYEYETLDLNAVVWLKQRRYRAILLAVLRSIYREEGLGGPITESVRRAFRLPSFA
ncbi:MAG TPA: hypothetical protein VE974_15600 [Thermoanaerobaculia bacterium]|nr:hypothetical protein [Thermoanaerobaculia bacterium]